MASSASSKALNIYTVCDYPCEWDDLLDDKGQVIASIFTFEYIKNEDSSARIGITQSEDGIYDIVVNENEINNKVVQKALDALSKITAKKYKFEGIHKKLKKKILNEISSELDKIDKKQLENLTELMKDIEADVKKKFKS